MHRVFAAETVIEWMGIGEDLRVEQLKQAQVGVPILPTGRSVRFGGHVD
jgi:hypothetical protein